MGLRKYFSVEVPLLLCYFSSMLLSTISTNLYVYRTCYVVLGYNESDCAQLGNKENNITIDLEPLVQPTVNHIEMVLRVTGTGIPAIFGMFVGTWSDNFGRKPFLLLSLIGLTLNTLFNTLIAYFKNMSPWYFVVSAIPSALTGGFGTVFVVTTMYLADVTTTKDRVLRMGIYEALMSTGSLLGNLVAPKLFYATNYWAVYGIATLLIVISVIYTIFAIPESLDVKKKIPTCAEISRITNFTQIVKVPFKKREKNRRFFLVVLIILVMFYNFSLMGDLSVRTLFLRKKLHWTLTQLSFASSYGSVTFILGTIFGTTVLYRKFKFKEIHLILLSVVMSTAANTLRSVAVNDYYIYIAYTLVSFGGLFTSMLRTLMSYIVEPTEVGKVYATSNFLDTLATTVANVLFPIIYNATIDIYTGAYYFVNMGIGVCSAIVVIILMQTVIPVRDDIAKEQEKNLEEEVKPVGKKISVDSVITY